MKPARHKTFPGKLNLFQRTMLRWRDLYPYNAVHVAHVAHAFVADDVRAAIGAVAQARGIAGFALNARRRRYVYRGGAVEFELAMLAGGSQRECDRVLADEIASQLNRGFGTGEPMRFFAVTANDGFMLGIAYDHFIAGGDSVAALLGAIVMRIMQPAGAPDIVPVAPPLYPSTYKALARRRPGWFAGSLARMPALARDSKRAFRPPDHDPDDSRNAFMLIRVAPAETTALRAQATRFGVTLHDLLIALLLRALSPLAIGRRHEPQRREIAVASIVNIRKDFEGDDLRAFGQFLASMRVMHAVPDGISLETLAQDVRNATQPIKRSHLYLRTLYALAAAAGAWRFLSKAQRLRFFTKHYPAWAGISMLDVDPSWPAAVRPAQLYTRGVSTGPLTPAVLAISTTSTTLSIGVSWRPAALPAEFATHLKAEILQCALQCSF